MELMVTQLVKKFPDNYETQMFLYVSVLYLLNVMHCTLTPHTAH
jgi:hypothetical protein